MRFAVVENGLVVNVKIAASALNADWIPTDIAEVGWTYNNGYFYPPDVQQNHDIGGGGGPIEPA